MVIDSLDAASPYAVAFVDMRMPPGIDGLETIERLWKVDPDLQIVISSAYSDHSWNEIRKRLGETDQLLILKKPFDPAEVSQLAVALTEKWRLTQQTREVTKQNVEQLISAENTISQRSRHLELATSLVGLGYCHLDLASGEFRISNRVAEIFKTDAESLKSLSDFLEVIEASDRERVSELFKLAIEFGEGFEIKSPFCMPQGQAGFVQVRFICEYDHNGEKASLFGVLQDVTDNENAIQAVKHASLHDSLTDLPNRAKLMIDLDEFPWGSDSVASLILVDVDHFKTVNDTYGHPVGDEFLREVGIRLLQAAGPDDTVARLGGDEFAVFQKNLGTREIALQTVKQFQESMREPFIIEGRTVHGSVSCGIATVPEDADSVEELIKKTDLALYRAKNDGRGDYRIYDKTMDESIRLRRDIESELYHALDQNQLELYYQPIVATEPKQIASMEALIRWNHPARGIVSPMDFIPIAEETGAIVPIGRWVIHQACLDATTWPEHVSVSVNVSAVQLQKEDFLSTVLSSLQHTKLAPNRLELEITETVFLNETDQTMSTLHGLREHGIHIVMDDFGIGHSSLAYLRQFPFDKIKLDKSFLLESLENRESKAIISVVSALGKSLGIRTCAEGVETEQHFALARTEEYSHCQGYLFGKPKPVTEAIKFFESPYLEVPGSSTPSYAQPLSSSTC
jgi:diguanylate cyclase (GGDEF)-like protein